MIFSSANDLLAGVEDRFIGVLSIFAYGWTFSAYQIT